MTIRTFARSLAAAAFTIAASAAASPTLIVTNGILTGANNVDVAGTLYNVTFVDGTCSAVFNGCTTAGFTFTSAAAAVLAVQALGSQVFVDGPDGAFNTTTNKVAGCTNTSYCFTLVPYAVSASGAGLSVGEYANYAGAADSAYTNDGFLVAMDFTSITQDNFAVFKLATAATNVPEPGSIALMGLALGALALARRRTR